MSAVKTAEEILQERIVELSQKVKEFQSVAKKTKTQYEELTSIREKLKDVVPPEQLEVITNQITQRIKENMEAVEQFEEYRTRLAEVIELLEIMGS
ncbi:MAG TPA: hypothetical protein PKV93_15055 [Fervidobacterium sp.]|nr:hypothetical protein [Fervidobacterium sp.]